MNLPDGRIAVYIYDPFGRRISKIVDGATTYFMYADEGLVAEMGSTGSVTKSCGWKPNSTWSTNPVLMVEGGSVYFYHNDHLGTPQKMTGMDGAVVWSAAYTAFGEATVDSAATVTNNLLFPGQYYDEETGLHYNFHRYYDPKTGDYITTDPIGLKGGINVYVYVGNNPIILKDPTGKSLCHTICDTVTIMIPPYWSYLCDMICPDTLSLDPGECALTDSSVSGNYRTCFYTCADYKGKKVSAVRVIENCKNCETSFIYAK